MTRLPSGSWRSRGWSWNLGGDTPENKGGGKYPDFSPLPTFNLPCCLSWLNLSGSQRANELRKCSSLQNRGERWEWILKQTDIWPACLSAAFIESYFILFLITSRSVFSMHKAICLFKSVLLSLFQDRDLFKNVRARSPLPRKIAHTRMILLLFQRNSDSLKPIQVPCDEHILLFISHFKGLLLFFSGCTYSHSVLNST